MIKKLAKLLILSLILALPFNLQAQSFVNTFGGTAVNPSQLAYAAYSFGAGGLQLFWPNFANGQPNVAATFMNLSATAAAQNVTMPDATLTSVGYAALIFNSGAQSFNVVGFTGGAIATIAPNQTYYIILSSNTTQNGTWKVVQFGVGTGSASASALAGPGLLAVAGLLQVNLNGIPVSSSFTLTTMGLAQLYVWTGGSGTITLPSAASVGNGFFFMVANNGSGSLTIAPISGTIDGNPTSVFSQTQSGFIISNGSNWITVGKGIQNTFAVTLLNLNVAGSSNVTETSAQAQNIIQQFTGALTGNISVIVPAVVQLYDINNQTTGAFTLTVKTASGTGIVVPQGQTSILYGDGTNVVNGFTASVTSTISLANGSALSPAISFAASPNTGLFSATSGSMSASANGFEVLRFLSQASSVNYFNMEASATGSSLDLFANGTDANISVAYIAKGAGEHAFFTEGPLSGTPVAQFVVTDTPSAVNALGITGSATTLAPSLFALGSDTNINLDIVPKGTGSLVTTNLSTTGTVLVGGNTTLDGTLTAASLATGGTIAGSICSTSGGAINYVAGGNCVAAGNVTLGTTAAATNPQRSGQADTGFYSLNSGELDFGVDVSATPTLEAKITSSGLNLPGLTASELVATDGSKNLTNVTALPNGTTATTQTVGDNTTKVATTAFVTGAAFAPLASPAFTGTPTAPTAAANTSTTQIATTAFANPASAVSANGYQKFPSGAIFEWVEVASVSGNSSSAVSLPLTFPSNIWNATCTPNTNNAGTQASDSVVLTSTSTITVFNNNSAPAAFSCLAIGN